MGQVSDLYATITPTPYVIPISDGSGTLNDWITALVNPMTTDQDIIVGGVSGTPQRLPVGAHGYVLTVGSGGLIDWEAATGGFTNPMTTSQDLIVGGISGAPGRLAVGSVGKVLTVGSGGIIDWETPAASGGTVTTVSVVSANGFAGTVATATTTPAITLTTTITGILSGNGTAISAASTTGSGAVVLANTPTLITPVIGAATGTSLVLTGGLTSGAVAGVTGFVALKGLTSGTFTMSVNDAAGTWTAKWPATGGTNGYSLTTDGSGNLSWTNVTGGATTPGGSNTQLQYNNSSAFGGISGATSNGTAVTFTAGNLIATSPKLITGINDTNGNELFLFTATASAVNEITVANAATNTSPTLTASGGDSSIDLVLTPKGIGAVIVKSASSQNALHKYNIGGTDKAIIGSSFAGAGSGVITGCAADDICIRNVASKAIVFSTDNGTTIAGQFVASTGQLSLPKNITSTSTTTGTLVVTGGAGISGAVFTGGAITTGTPSGGTAGAWKFGVLVTAAVVPDTTRYIQLDVGGTLYKVIIST